MQLIPSKLSMLRNQVFTQSLIQVWASSESKIGKIRDIIEEQNGTAMQTKNEVLLAELDVSAKADFMDGYHHQVLLEYTASEELNITLIDAAAQHQQRQGTANNIKPLVTIPLKLTDYISLDNGTAYLGFTQETQNLANVLLIENWAFESSVKANQRDPWSGLSLDYNCQWPIHLMFSPDVTEKYNTLFRFLLPIKRVQLELQYIWAQKVRSMKHLDQEPVFRLTLQLRQHMSFLIDNIYSYLQVDVLESQWLKLNQGVQASRDFEEVRMLHDQYLDSILEQCFLNLPEVLKALQDVLLMCTKLCRLLREIDEDEMKNKAF